ncbi:MAG: hypothetical protein MSA50_10170 [Veillonellaceae bacterium]|nr:hypothetical protein [Veillonellaceae bacterium]
MKTKACLAAALLAFAAAFSLSAALPQTAAANQKVFRKVTATDKTQATALLDEGDQLRKAGRYEEAMHKYTEAIHIDESLGGYAYRALCRLKMGDDKGAFQDVDTSVHQRSASDLLRPGMSGLAEYVRGLAACRLGKYDQARADFTRIRGTEYAKDIEVLRAELELGRQAAGTFPMPATGQKAVILENDDIYDDVEEEEPSSEN